MTFGSAVIRLIFLAFFLDIEHLMIIDGKDNIDNSTQVFDDVPEWPISKPKDRPSCQSCLEVSNDIIPNNTDKNISGDYVEKETEEIPEMLFPLNTGNNFSDEENDTYHREDMTGQITDKKNNWTSFVPYPGSDVQDRRDLSNMDSFDDATQGNDMFFDKGISLQQQLVSNLCLVNYINGTYLCDDERWSCRRDSMICHDNDYGNYPCSCDFKCEMYNDCCHDYNTTCKSKHANARNDLVFDENVKVTCPVVYDNFYAFNYVIGSCLLEFRNTSIEERCIDTTHSRIVDLLQVYERRRDLVYKNKACALCNNISPKDIELMNYEFLCPINWDVPVTSPNQLRQKILNGSCYRVQYVDGKETHYRNCIRDIVETCSATYMYNDVRNRCENGYVSYVSKNKVYKNIYCFICNMNSNESLPVFVQSPANNRFFNTSMYRVNEVVVFKVYVSNDQYLVLNTEESGNFAFNSMLSGESAIDDNVSCLSTFKRVNGECILRNIPVAIEFNVSFSFLPSPKNTHTDVLKNIQSVVHILRASVLSANTSGPTKHVTYPVIATVQYGICMEDILSRITQSLSYIGYHSTITDIKARYNYIPSRNMSVINQLLMSNASTLFQKYFTVTKYLYYSKAEVMSNAENLTQHFYYFIFRIVVIKVSLFMFYW